MLRAWSRFAKAEIPTELDFVALAWPAEALCRQLHVACFEWIARTMLNKHEVQ